jgi:AraC-like DNA-binding protein
MQSIIEAVPYQFHFKIHKMGNLKVPPTWGIETYRSNEDLHLLYVKGGEGFYDFNGVKESLHEGKILFVSNECLHSATPDKNHLPEIIPIRFGLYHNQSKQFTKWFHTPFFFSLTPDSKYQFRHTFTKLYHAYINKHILGKEQLCSALLNEIMVDIFNILNDHTSRAKDNRIEEIVKLIRRHPQIRYTVEDLSAKTGLSKKQLTRLFNKYYQSSPKQFVLENMITYAGFLLTETEMSIIDISTELNFPDPYSFSKLYKRMTGMSPSQMRQSSYQES